MAAGAIYKGNPVAKSFFRKDPAAGGAALGLGMKTCLSRIVIIYSESHKKNIKH